MEMIGNSAPPNAATSTVLKGINSNSMNMNYHHVNVTVSMPVDGNTPLISDATVNNRVGRYYLPSRRPPPKLHHSKKPQYARSASIYIAPSHAELNISMREIMDSRPPLRLDLSTPGPWTYSPHNVKPLNETNSPAFSIAARCWPEKNTGSRTSWSKTWFQTPEVWTTKTNFHSEANWPSPSSYDNQQPIGGKRMVTINRYPSYTMGHKTKIGFAKAGAEFEPGPNDYHIDRADRHVYRRSPTVIHSFRPKVFDVWRLKDKTPGPAHYSPQLNLVKQHHPSFSLSKASRDCIRTGSVIPDQYSQQGS